MRRKIALFLLVAIVFLGGAFGLGFSTGALTTNHRLDCRQAHDSQVIDLFAKLVAAARTPQFTVIEHRLATLPPTNC